MDFIADVGVDGMLLWKTFGSCRMLNVVLCFPDYFGYADQHYCN